MNGVISIYKEKGFTSFDVVAKLRGILKTRKIGHTGTLDPDAEGVLPVCVGNATGLCGMLTEKDKVYETVLLFGTETDTQDMTGTVLRVSDNRPSKEEVLKTLQRFTGTYEQLPPMYSAIRVQGRRLYELAREGKEVSRMPRPVTIYRLEVTGFVPEPADGVPDRIDEVAMRVACSKGTYIRTLCQDIGAALGCGGCMKQLIRIQSGNFTAADSFRLAQVEAMAAEGIVQEALIPVDRLLPYPAFMVREEQQRLLENGNPLAKQELIVYSMASAPLFAPEETERIRVYLPDGEFVGVYGWRPEKNSYYPVKMFLNRKRDEQPGGKQHEIHSRDNQIE